MSDFLPTIILRHRKENLKKCSLTGLEGREDFKFYTYPKSLPENLDGYCILSFDGEEISEKDTGKGIYLLDATWKYAEKMSKTVPEGIPTRSLPKHYRTAYPRKQDDCSEKERGLASIEALYIAFKHTGRPTKGLLDHYHFKDAFLSLNNLSDDLNNNLESDKSHQKCEHSSSTK